MYINIHSHSPAVGAEWVLQSIYQALEGPAYPKHFSAGLHPWYLNKDVEISLEILKTAVASPQCLAVGECGLDKVCDTDFTLQSDTFERQVLLANDSRKPLIIHCVKAFDEVQAILNKTRNKVPVLFHGFNKSRELALQLTTKGYYLSFGKALAKDQIRVFAEEIPHSQLLLETDDSAVSIETIYGHAADAFNISPDDLILQIQKNAEQFLQIKL